LIATINPVGTGVRDSYLFSVTLDHLQETWLVISPFNLEPSLSVVDLIISKVNALSALRTHAGLPVHLYFMNKHRALEVFEL